MVHDQFCVSGQYTFGIIVSSWGDSQQPCPGTRVQNVEILDNIVYNQGRVGIILYPSNNNDACYISDILVRGNEVYDTAQQEGYEGGDGIGAKNNVKNVVIEHNYIHGYHGSTGQCSLFNADIPGSSGPSNIVYRYNVITTTSPTGIHFWNHGNIDIQIYGNIIFNIGGSMGVMANYNLADSFNARIYNNLLYNCNLTISNYPGSTDTLEISNNIIHANGVTPLADYAGKITSHSSNLYYRSDGGTLVSSGGTTYNASSIISYETSAVTGDAALVDPANVPTGFTGTYGVDLRPNTDGFAPMSGSPAVNAGIDLGTPFDASINSVLRPQGSGWDIGPYEFEEAAVNKPMPPQNLRLVQ
jgi:hypothetical protein